MADVLVLDRVTKRFDGTVAVSELSWRVPRGCVYGLIGPNGSGKTTTIRMILDIFVPDGGTIEVLGRRPDARTRDRVGYLPEERGLYKKMRVGEVLAYLGRLKRVESGELKRSVSSWLERFGLLDRIHRPVEDLSKGMQQKVQFIATVLHKPELLILDEPFSGLDPVSADALKDAVLELRKGGCTVLFSTHVMEAAEKLCDSVLMLSRGRKVLDGPLGQLRREHGADVVALEYEGAAGALAGLAGVAAINDYGQYAELRLEPGADTQALLKGLLERVKVRRFHAHQASLHEIFRKSVGDVNGS